MPPIDVPQWIEDGYCVAQNLLSEDEVHELRDEMVAFARGKYPIEGVAEDTDSSDETLQRNILCIHFPHAVSPLIRSFVSHPKISDILQQITAAHLGPWWDGRVKCMQSMFFAKGPGKPGQAWHQDEIYIPTRDRSLVGAWIAVDDATVDNGCLWVLPGSHKAGHLYPQRKHDNPDFDFAGESYGFDDRSEIPVEVPAGSVVLFNGYLLHRSKPNRNRPQQSHCHNPLPAHGTVRRFQRSAQSHKVIPIITLARSRDL